MLGTLTQIAQEMICFEAEVKNTSVDLQQLNRLCENPQKKDEDIKVLVIDFDSDQCYLEDYKDDDRYKYLFARSTGMQAIGPAWVVDFSKKGKEPIEIAKTSLKQINTSLKLLTQDLKNDDKNWAEYCLDLISKHNDYIINEIINNKNIKRFLLSIQYKGKKPGEIKSLCDSFVNKRLLGGERAQYEGNTFCGICSKKAVVRPSIPFDDFFTVEKRGFAPMASEIDIWKYAPLCADCTKWLYIGQNFLYDRLRTRVAGKPAYLIPNIEPGTSKIKGSFLQYLWEFQERSKKRISPNVNDFPESDPEDEQEAGFSNLFRGLVETSDQWDRNPPFRSASLVFYQPGQKFRFLYTTADILPNQLKKLKNQLSVIRVNLRKGILSNVGKSISKKINEDLEFVNNARQWPKKRQKGSSEGKKKDTSGTLILDSMILAEAIITLKPPLINSFWTDVDSILHALYLETITDEEKFTVKQKITNRIALFWVIWALLYDNYQGGEIMPTEEKVEHKKFQTLPADFWEKFFREKRMLDDETKRALFLIGTLFGKVESKQRKERQQKSGGEMPILGRLRGLTISYQDITKNLFPELKLKLRQLSGAGRVIREIESAASDCLTKANTINDTEARFYFCLGWSLEWNTYFAIKDILGVEEDSEDDLEPEEDNQISE